MKATVNVLCYKSKILKNGEHPLMVCVCKDRKRKYISIGMSVNPRFYIKFCKNKLLQDFLIADMVLLLKNAKVQL